VLERNLGVPGSIAQTRLQSKTTFHRCVHLSAYVSRDWKAFAETRWMYMANELSYIINSIAFLHMLTLSSSTIYFWHFDFKKPKQTASDSDMNSGATKWYPVHAIEWYLSKHGLNFIHWISHLLGVQESWNMQFITRFKNPNSLHVSPDNSFLVSQVNWIQMMFGLICDI